MPEINLEFKDWILVISFGASLITAWTRIKLRQDRADEVHVEIKDSLSELVRVDKERHIMIKSTLKTIGSDIGEIKTSVAVMENEQGNLKSRVDKLED